MQVYIVYLGERQHEDPQVVVNSHHDLLTTIFGSKKEASDSILYSYKHGFSGFAARLTETQARAIAGTNYVVLASTIKQSQICGEITIYVAKLASYICTFPFVFLTSTPRPRFYAEQHKIPPVPFFAHTYLFYSIKKLKVQKTYMNSHNSIVNVAELPEVVHVTPSQTHKLHTTRSWDYLGLHPGTPDSLLSTANSGDGVIIGVIDSGIWPESQSFNDEGLGAVPSKWRGRCEGGENFNTSNCNNKIVGARFFAKGFFAERGGVPPSLGSDGEYLSPRDANGHGTHTASTAAGSFVRNASYGGLGWGLARGGAPRARLAIYKTCWGPLKECDKADMLAAFDSAIGDGVDIISVSVGRNQPPLPGYLDNLNGWSIGAFHAVARGITVVCSGGNAGPFPQKVTNGAPWIMTVAASTIDHSFPTAITLGNNRTLIISAYFLFLSFSTLISCDPGSLNSSLAKGKVVLCFTDAKDPIDQFSKAADTVSQAGGAGIIFAMHTTNFFGPCGSISCVQVDYEIGTEILAYIRATRLPKARISRTRDTIGKVASPKVAYFSSRGPNSLSLDVLKPDIAAPGVNILAAGPNSNPYFFDSGTSMACPHVSGVAALLKSLHPHWSPAAINVTNGHLTAASVTNRYGEHITAEGGPRKIADPFDFGGGHVNPNRAANPGLVYDMGVADYVQFLCSLGYSSSAISRLSIKAPSCGSGSSVFNLNLPSITVSNLKKTTTVARTVTNVGPVSSTYRVEVEAPSGVRVSVEPQTLNFHEKVKALTFTVTFSPVREIQGDFSFGSLTWMDGKHVVRIPLVTRVLNQSRMKNKKTYFFASGTSMACPHVSAVAALLKSLHPHWSPAAIKSAIVTTASVTNGYGEPITAEGGPRKIADPFDFGGGHVNPNRAANPGLVYDMGVADYVQFLCSLGYSSSAISRLSIKAPSCGSRSSVFNLNLPSITISNLKKTTTVARTVTNVGPVSSTYRVKVEAPSGVRVSVEPQTLNFNEKVKALTFAVTFSPVREIQGDFSFGSLTWMDGRHVVRIPLVTRVVLQDSYADIS
ncbi:hypothetical protein EJ110_NYTH49719 [Nymphaea thermarum]|nr:hypothetical protein EJ110_NYTH49719 [Nymphaea thermarum]